MNTIQLLRILLLSALLFAFSSGTAMAQWAGERARDFTLEDLEGKPHRLSDYRGKVVVLNFWASWCGECIKELPSLNAFNEKFRNRGVVVLGISADRKKEAVQEVLRKTPLGFPQIIDTTGGVFIRSYTVTGLPTTYIIDKEGKIADRIPGYTDFGSGTMTAKIVQLLERKVQ